MLKQKLLPVSIATILGATAIPAQAQIITTDWEGLFTLVSPETVGGGTNVFKNTSKPYYYDATWGYGLRTQISGTFSYDTNSGQGTGSVSGFEWGNAGIWQISDLTLQAVGDGSGGSGNLIQGNLLYDWNGSFGLSGTIIWDASGFLNAGPYTAGANINNTGALPASDTLELTPGNFLPIGPSPFAAISADAALPLSDDGRPGARLPSGPWVDWNINTDITSMTVTSVSAVPIPAAVWLFASGLIGLAGLIGRKLDS